VPLLARPAVLLSTEALLLKPTADFQTALDVSLPAINPGRAIYLPVRRNLPLIAGPSRAPSKKTSRRLGDCGFPDRAVSAPDAPLCSSEDRIHPQGSSTIRLVAIDGIHRKHGVWALFLADSTNHHFDTEATGCPTNRVDDTLFCDTHKISDLGQTAHARTHKH
jgi:hypothetical protein